LTVWPTEQDEKGEDPPMSGRAIWSVIVRSCNVRSCIFNAPCWHQRI